MKKKLFRCVSARAHLRDLTKIVRGIGMRNATLRNHLTLFFCHFNAFVLSLIQILARVFLSMCLKSRTLHISLSNVNQSLKIQTFSSSSVFPVSCLMPHVSPGFRKAPYSNCFPFTRKRKAGFFKFFQFEELFRKAQFS